jgi:hypothetical protein
MNFIKTIDSFDSVLLIFILTCSTLLTRIVPKLGFEVFYLTESSDSGLSYSNFDLTTWSLATASLASCCTSVPKMVQYEIFLLFSDLSPLLPRYPHILCTPNILFNIDVNTKSLSINCFDTFLSWWTPTSLSNRTSCFCCQTEVLLFWLNV